MAVRQITREQYHDKVAGGWLGRNAGATLGVGLEGTDLRSIQFYDPMPGQPAAHDGMDFQLVWLHLLRTKGIDQSSDDLADVWADHIAYSWDEFGWASSNLRRGLRAPISGSFNNWFKTGQRGVSRCDVWGMTAPGAPQTAASNAYRDAVIDHAADGVWAAMFWAAMESAAFFVSDPLLLIEVGIAMIPENSRTTQAVRIARDAFRADASLIDTRSRIINALGHENFADAPMNIGFSVAGLLYGKGDFGTTLSATAGLGYGTQTNAAAVGGLLGIVQGKTGLPANWIQPLGDAVVLGWGVVDLKVEHTVSDLVDHTVEIAELMVAAKCPDIALVDVLEEPAPAAEPPVVIPTPTIADESDAAAPSTTSAAPDLSPEQTAAAPLPETNQRAEHLEIDPLPPSEEPSPMPAEAAISTTAPVESAAPSIGMAAPTDAPPSTEPTADFAETPATTAESAGSETAVSTSADSALMEAALSSPPPPAINWRENTSILPLLAASSSTAIYGLDGYEFTVDYGENGPAIVPNRAMSFTIAVRNLTGADFMGKVALGVPEGWQVAVPGAQGQRQMLARGGMARYGFVVRVPEEVSLNARNEVTFVMTPESAPAVSIDLPLFGGSCWWFVGPFRNLADEGFDHAYGPEDKPGLENDYLGRDGGLIRWQRHAFTENVMDLESLLNGSAGVAYGITTLHVPATTDARILTHTNDGVKVWLNSQRILLRHSHEPFRPSLAHAPASADVTLKPGDNQVIVKAVRCGQPLRFSFAVTDREGRPLDDVGNSRW